jgi:hypothetical protein
MLSVTVHKDIGEYTEKIVGKLSARTLACTAGGIGAAVGTAAFVYLGLGIPVSDATMPVMAASMPFWLLGFWRPRGLKAEEFLPLYLDHALDDGVVTYRTGSDPAGMAGDIACEKTDRRARRAAARKGAERREPSKEQER